MADQCIATQRAWVIYALIDPRTQRPRYVGFTTNLKRRLAEHFRFHDGRSGTHKRHWLAEVFEAGLSPTAIILQRGVGPNWAQAEIEWIRYLRDAGCLLTNSTAGGDGTTGYRHSETTIAILKHQLTGRKQSAATVEKRMRHVRGVPKSLEHRAKLAASKVGYRPTAESVEKGRITQKGRPNPSVREWWATRTPEQIVELKLKMAAAHRRRRERLSYDESEPAQSGDC